MKHKRDVPTTASAENEPCGDVLLAHHDRDLCDEVGQQLAQRRNVLVAFSGGLDSTVLLDTLARLRHSRIPDLALRAIYIHHGLSVNADTWADHCQRQCELRQVDYQMVKVSLDAANGGIEAAARSARYHALQRALLPGETLLTAQHLDDQSETLLLALKRGSGPAGLSSMAESSLCGQHELLRPLLGVSRAQLSDYAECRQLTWIEDDSNRDPRFDRNFLRLQILPLLKQRWPHFSRAAARSAQLCAEQEALLDELLEESLRHLTQADGSLDLAPMMTMGSARRGALIRRWLAAAGVRMPSQDQLSRLWNEVVLSRPDAAAQWVLADRQIRRFRQRLFILPLQLPPLSEQVLEWPNNTTSLMLPQTLGTLRLAAPGQTVRAPTARERVTVRFGAHGVLHIVGRVHGRSLKKIWQEQDIAPWQRERTPLLYYNEQLIMAPGIFVTQEGQAREGGEIWQVEWVPVNSTDGQ
ncbi:tRNA lysidine(34) synthetase TilS [Acerihabitans sp. TG2]|uniref:tRNA lysidine(34) synthetase TilS n=1 Tax=Acerihabitans sp. TG2 TaxID=3096008 RepID=UPI002B226C71|nr:tRNA lysidine(34) synthetase TilS [Acerihabitans sp. TG2]MEA9393193.1 tRNA lysidine(34) synthetase TilS [Acerihabitans sp. TG2]